jgi:hypothetical protein
VGDNGNSVSQLDAGVDQPGGAAIAGDFIIHVTHASITENDCVPLRIEQRIAAYHIVYRKIPKTHSFSLLSNSIWQFIFSQ